MVGCSHGHVHTRAEDAALSWLLRFAGVVLTCGKDNLLKLVDPRTFQARCPLANEGQAYACRTMLGLCCDACQALYLP